MKLDIFTYTCSVCRTSFTAARWESGSCPMCKTDYWWDERVSADFGSAWDEVCWERYSKDELLTKGEQSVSNKTIECLNAAFATDPNAIHALMVNRVPCNLQLAADPHIPVDTVCVLPELCWQIGALGLINGILNANGLPLVAAKYSEERDAAGRATLLGFMEYIPTVPEVQSCAK